MWARGGERGNPRKRQTKKDSAMVELIMMKRFVQQPDKAVPAPCCAHHRCTAATPFSHFHLPPPHTQRTRPFSSLHFPDGSLSPPPCPSSLNPTHSLVSPAEGCATRCAKSPSFVTSSSPVVATSKRPTVKSRGRGSPSFLCSHTRRKPSSRLSALRAAPPLAPTPPPMLLALLLPLPPPPLPLRPVTESASVGELAGGGAEQMNPFGLFTMK